MKTEVTYQNIEESLTNMLGSLEIVPYKTDHIRSIITVLKSIDTDTNASILTKKLITFLEHFEYRTWGSLDTYSLGPAYKEIFGTSFFEETNTDRNYANDVLIDTENKKYKRSTELSSASVIPTYPASYQKDMHGHLPTNYNRQTSMSSESSSAIYDPDSDYIEPANIKIPVSNAIKKYSKLSKDDFIGLMNWRDDSILLLERMFPKMDPEIDVDTILFLFNDYLGITSTDKRVTFGSDTIIAFDPEESIDIDSDFDPIIDDADYLED